MSGSRQPRVYRARSERFGRLYEELVPGDRYEHWPGKTITEADDHLFCLLTMAASPIHIDAEYARIAMPGGRNIVVGTYVYALVLGMSVPDVSGRAVVNLGLERMRHVAPVHHGDTLYATTVVHDRRPSRSRPELGIVTVDTSARNQHGETVIEFRRAFMVPKSGRLDAVRPGPPGSADPPGGAEMLLATEPVGLEPLEMFANGLDHAEGIAVLRDGTIYVGGEAGQVYRVAGDGGFEEVANTGGFALGVAADGEGRLYVCDSVHKAVMRVNPADGAVETFSSGTAERPMAVPNWGAFDGAGNYYVSDSGDWQAADGLIWVVRPGSGAEVWSEESVNFPNGLAVAPDGSCLYAVESTPDAAIVEIPIEADGSAGPRRVLCELGLAVPDGVAVAADGALIVACYRPDVIYRWHPDDGLELLAGDPQGVVLAAPTNVAFGGEDLGELIVPNLGRWHLTRGRTGVTGTPLFYPTADQLEG